MFSVSVYKETEQDTIMQEDLTFETKAKADAIEAARAIADQIPDVFVEVWKRDRNGLYGNCGEPVYATKGSAFYKG